MILNASDAIIMSKEDGRRLLKAIYVGWNKERIERLIKLGLLESVSQFRESLKENEEDC